MSEGSVFDKKICIIGAGPSGLGTARYLQDKGYKNVTVLERHDKPGGKAHTVTVDGYAYDMGALEMNWADTYTRAFMDEYEAEPVGIQLIELLDDKTGDIRPMIDLAPSLKDKVDAMTQSMAYLKEITAQHDFCNGATFAGLPMDLAQPFSSWLEEHGLQELEWVFQGVLFSFGYGYQSEIPAAYVLKFMHWQNFLTVLEMFGTELVGHPPYWPMCVKGGFQSLFERVAEDVRDLRLGVNISSVERGGDHPVTVTYRQGEGAEVVEHFDRLIVTALPRPDQLSEFMDLTSEERDLFSNVTWNHYWSVLVKNGTLPRENLLVLTAGGVRQLPPTGHPVAYVCNHTETDVFVMNGYSEADTTPEQMRQNIIEAFERQGLGEVYFPEADDGAETFCKWDFFPHVKSEAMRAGFYDKLEHMQGENATYWAGGLLNFEIVESTLHNASALVDQHFSEASWDPKWEEKIAIIGAGPAGLSAALYLEDKGYKNVTVLERNDWVGGKVHSYFVDDQAYDMGALEVTKAYKEVLQLMDRFGVESYPIQALQVIDGQSGEVSALSTITPGVMTKIEVGLQVTKYFGMLAKYGKWIEQPDMRGCPDDLTQPFGQWLDKHGMSALREPFMPAIFCYGYGTLDDFSAAYALKYMKKYNFEALVSVLLRQEVGLDPKWPKSITGGFQSLFVKLSEVLTDVRTGVTEMSIERGDDGVGITYTRDGQTVSERYDKLIVTAIQETEVLEHYLDVQEPERVLFDQVIHNDYYTIAVDAAGFPPVELYILKQDGRLQIPSDGDPVSFIRHYEDNDTLVVYSYASVPSDKETIERKLVAALERMGGRDINIRHTFRWKYFPRVDPRSLKDGFYDKVHELQGENATYWAGGLMNFEDVENTVAFSKALVARWF